ncbi:hypothetical protein ACVWY0_001270 [Arthrobacter sp. UYNi723]
MDIKKATLADAWHLAWTGSLAFACGSKKPWPRVRAVLGYPRHIAYIVPAALEGSLWHRNRRVVVGITGIDGQRNGYSHWVLAGLLLILLGPLDLTVLLVVLGLLLIALMCGRPIRRFRASAAVRSWKKDLHHEPVYEIVYLAKHPYEKTYSGFGFAKEVLSGLVPAGSRLCTIARSDRHVRGYRARRFQELPYKGKPTAGMAGVLAE